MAINYSVRKKVDKTGDEPKVLYYAVGKALQGRGQRITENFIAEKLADRSSLSKGDVMSVFKQLPDLIARYLKDGKTVNIEGLGTFYPAVSSEGVKTPEECTADKIKITRICYKADKALTYEVRQAKFMSIELKEQKKKNKEKQEKLP